jgi:hypothetical protein
MDSTNQGIASANVTPGGTTAQAFAVKRLERQQQLQAVQRPGRVQPPVSIRVKKGV